MMRSLSRVSVRNMATARKKPVRVTVTGPAGQIGYALLFRLCSGDFLGPNQPVILQCLELPQGLKALEGVTMELRDCAFPLLADVIATDDAARAFDGADFAFLVGAKPRTKGMERADLLLGNAEIFSAQGKAINRAVNRDTFKCVVVGNPANTNALIASANAPQIDPKRFSAMTRLDHNRGLAQLAAKTGSHVDDIEKFVIWGNHSPTMYPDLSHCTIKGRPAKSLVDQAWIEKEFIPQVQQRGAAIIAARGASSAASAAGAAIDHMRDWVLGTQGKWTSMGVYSGSAKDGKGLYDMGTELYYSVPVVCEGGEYKVVKGLSVDAFSKDRMSKSAEELEGEKKAVGELAKRK